MHSSDFDALFSSLNEAVAILNRHRTSDPEFVAALDTLKQARAKIARLTDASFAAPETDETPAVERELVAA
jgi:hypothetical protein